MQKIINMFAKKWLPIISLIGVVLGVISLFWDYKIQKEVTIINNTMPQNAGNIVSGNRCTNCGTGVEFNKL